MDHRYSNLTMRIITGAVLCVTVGAVVLSNQPYVLRAFSALLSVVGVYELYLISGQLKQYALFVISDVIAIAFNFLDIPYFACFLTAVYAGSLLLFLIIMNRLGKTDLGSPVKIFILGAVISFLFSSFGYFVRFHNGNLYLLLILTEISMIDIGSYFIGRSFGQHHIFPKLSPNKSLEGYIGGVTIPIVLLTAVTVILSINRVVTVNWIGYALFTVCVAAAALFGDLAMSAVKRVFGVKDFSQILPGHGGVLDRFDSLLFALPFAYLIIYYTGEFFVIAT